VYVARDGERIQRGTTAPRWGTILVTLAAAAATVLFGTPSATADAAVDEAGTTSDACPNGYVSLTFDDGPDVHTPDVLDVLADLRVPGVFFVEGEKVAQWPSLAVRADAEGHRLANHTYYHERLTELTDEEIRWTVRATDEAIRDAGPTPLPLLRPTYGDTDARVAAAVADVGYQEVTWTIDPRDWEAPADTIVSRVLEGLHAGAIVVLHDGSSNTPETIQALPDIVSEVRDRGYCFGSLDRDGTVRPGGFQDVEGSPHAHAIARARTAAITDGCDAVGDHYCPNDPVQRDQMASFLGRALELDLTGSPDYPDVAGASVHAGAIAAVTAAGIAEGYEDGTYRPGSNVTRAQMAAFLARAYDLEAAGTPPYEDVGDGGRHAEAIAAVTEAGIAEGWADGTFRPTQGVTRAQMASFLDRAGAT
jgi:peptidoglycan/xylan/chitin deacetylase (PgdA/CDA1 family)